MNETLSNKRRTLLALRHYFRDEVFTAPTFSFDYDMARYVQTNMRLHRPGCFGFGFAPLVGMIWSRVEAVGGWHGQNEMRYFYPTTLNTDPDWRLAYVPFRLTHYPDEWPYLK